MFLCRQFCFFVLMFLTWLFPALLFEQSCPGIVFLRSEVYLDRSVLEVVARGVWIVVAV